MASFGRGVNRPRSGAGSRKVTGRPSSTQRCQPPLSSFVSVWP